MIVISSTCFSLSFLSLDINSAANNRKEYKLKDEPHSPMHIDSEVRPIKFNRIQPQTKLLLFHLFQRNI